MKTGLIWVWFAVGMGTFAASAQADTFDWKARLNAVAQQHVQNERNVGIVIGVVKDGETWIQSYGQSKQGDPSAPNDKTFFEIGSVSKVFTGVALGQIVAEGKAQLNDPISKYLPELNGKPAGAITFRELTTHTSGLPRLPTNLKPTDPKDPYKDYRESDLLSFLMGFQFQKPGPYRVDYSNVGVGLLGYVLSQISGTDYDRMIRQLITMPLGMNDTGVALSQEQLARIAQGHDSALNPTSLWDLNALAGAGGIRSTLADMLTFMRANIAPEKTSIATALSMSHQVQVRDPEVDVGLGWFIIDSQADNPMIAHNGQTGGFHSLIAFKPKEQTGVVMLTNTASAVQCVSSLAFGKECEPKKEHAHSEAQLRSFVGTFEFEPAVNIEIARHNSFLTAQITGQGKIRLTAESQGKFDVGGDLATITFGKNAGDEVDHLVLTQDGADYMAKRVRNSAQAELSRL